MLTYAFSVLVLGEAVLASKVTAVALSVGGIAMIAAFGDGSGGGDGSGDADLADVSNRIGGDLLSIGAATAYALYEVCFKRSLGAQGRPAALSSVPSPILSSFSHVCA